jgi:hypothetical protein
MESYNYGNGLNMNTLSTIEIKDSNITITKNNFYNATPMLQTRQNSEERGPLPQVTIRLDGHASTGEK